MFKYPFSFFAEVDAQSGIGSLWKSTSQKIQSTCSIPPEFEGPGGGLSPEDLFAQALGNCFVATFKVFVEKSKLNFSELSTKVELVVDLDESKKPVMRRCLLKVVVSGCDNPDRVKILAEKAFKSGFIINSVKTEMAMELQVT